MRPNIDALEDKALLSNLAIGFIGPNPLLRAEVHRANSIGLVVNSAGVHHSSLQAATPAAVSPSAAWMSMSMSTDKTTYRVGETVTMSLTIKNVSPVSHTIQLGGGHSAFYITQNGISPVNGSVYWRQVQPPAIVYKTLAPGQSVTLSAQCAMTKPGTFVVWNEMCEDGPWVTFTVSPGPVSTQH
jgi:hypothetical protein